MMKQNLEEILWKILENFCTGLHIFNTLFQEFEEKVNNLCSEKQIPRKELRDALTIDDWIMLVNLGKLKNLLDQYLSPLKKLLQQLRQNSYYNPEFSCGIFESHISDLYYNLGSLYSESYHFSSQAFAYLERPSNPKDTAFLPKKISETLFKKMERLKECFAFAKEELEILIRQHKEKTIILRSLFLFGEEILNPIYENGFSEFIHKIYIPDHLFELYVRAAHSFLSSGFPKEALKAAHLAANLLELPEYQFSEDSRRKLQDFFRLHQSYLASHNGV